MKKKISAIIMTSVIAVTLAGCHQGNTSAQSSQTQNSVQSSVSNSTNAENSQNSSQSNVSSQSDSQYLTMGVTNIDIKDANVSSKGTDLSKPEIFTITSVSDLKKFYSENKDKYSLDDVDSGQTFTDGTKDFDATFFVDSNVVIILQTYNSDDGIDIGEAYIDSGKLKINVYKTEAKDKSKTAYVCSLITLGKKDMGKNTLSVETLKPQPEIFDSQAEEDSSAQTSQESSKASQNTQ